MVDSFLPHRAWQKDQAVWTAWAKAQRLTAFAVLEGLSLVPAPTWQLATICNPRSRRPGPFGLSGIHMMYIQTFGQSAHGDKNKKNSI